MKTSVEFLLEKYKSQNTLLFAEDFEQAKEMDKEQMIEFACQVYDLNHGKDKSFRKAAEDYYNETFKK